MSPKPQGILKTAKPRGILKPAKLRGILKGTHSNSNSIPPHLTENQSFLVPPQFRKEENLFPYGSHHNPILAPQGRITRLTVRTRPKRRVKFTNPEVTLEVYPELPELQLERYLNLNDDSDDESTQSAPPTSTDLDSSFFIHNSYTGYPWSPILPHRSNSILPEPNVVPFRSTSNPNREYPPHPPFVPPSPQNNILGLNFTTEPFTPQRKTRHHPANLPSATYYRELDHHDPNEPEPDFPVCDEESEMQTTHFQSQHSQREHGRTAPWATPSHNRNNPHGAPKKPIDFEFIASMAHRRRQTHGTSSSGGASTSSGSLALGSAVSVSSSIFSSLSELSFLSPDPAVEFPPTPVFRDEVPEGLFMQRGESASTPGLNLGNSNSHHPWQQRDLRLPPSGSNYLS